MIKVAILGAGDRRAGELIRILVNHPDVALDAMCEPSLVGKAVSEIHHGLVGETEMQFCSNIGNQPIDVAFKLQTTPLYTHFCEYLLSKGGKVVDMTNEKWDNLPYSNELLGLSEIFRKPLVRGATRCVAARPVETAVLVALFPLALNLLLNPKMKLTIEASNELVSDKNMVGSAEIIYKILKGIQQSFDYKINYNRIDSSHPRCLRAKIEMPSTLSLDTVMEMYSKVYDDHNFVVVDSKDYPFKEVEGTNRCIISVKKETPDTLIIDSILDGRLRGGAGEAVHAMNLLFGLHEKTGLSLKASVY